jgi:hypothetical protein
VISHTILILCNTGLKRLTPFFFCDIHQYTFLRSTWIVTRTVICTLNLTPKKLTEKSIKRK